MRSSVLKLALAFAVIAFPAAAQWQVPSGSIPVGKGPGFMGFNTVTGSGGAGAKCLLDTTPPSFGSCGSGSGLTVGISTITSGNNGRVLFDNSGVLGEYTITGTAGSVVMSGNPTIAGFTSTAQSSFNITRTIASATAANLDDITVPAATATVTGATGSPITRLSKFSIYQPTFTDASAVVVTDLATLYTDGQPIVAGALTATRTWSELHKNGSMWINGTGQTNSRLLVGNFVPVDWPVDAFVVSSELSGQNAVAINSAPFLTTPPGSNKNALGFTTQAQISGAFAWTLWTAAKFNPLFITGGGSIVNQYGLDIAPFTGGSGINQAIWVEGGSTTGRVGLGDSNAQYQLVVSNNATAAITAGSGTQAAIIGADGTGGNMRLVGFGGTFANPFISGLKISGTAAAPTLTLGNVNLFQVFGEGYNGVTPGTNQAGARIDFVTTASNWSGTNNGAEFAFFTTPNASITTAEAIRVLGAGNVKFSNAANFSANAAVATVLGSVGPTGSHTTVQKWLTIVDNGGTTGYVPVF